jgi:ERCC4-type nuclease
MTMLSVAFGIPVLRSQSEAETANLILTAARQMQAQPRPPARKLGRARGKRAWQIRILTGIPGIGPTRAQRMLEQFGSVEAIATATSEALATVEGIGRKTAQRIHWAVHESPEPYRA